MDSQPIVVNPEDVKEADLVVGIPSYKEADSISLPTDIAARGLLRYFPEYRSVIINVDNHSPDGTREAFLNTPSKVPKVYISTPEGVRGKGNNLRNLFRAATELDARAVAVVDADLESITPRWIRYLLEPILQGADYVSPIYVRHKYDGTITNQVAYPMLRTLYGLRTRQPIGGDFGFSTKLARAFLAEKFWNERVAHFGIDIWMTTIAIARHFNVCQTFLGTPKIHRVKDPAADLGPMFVQVVGTLFDMMIEFEYLWAFIRKSVPSAIYGFGLGAAPSAPEVQVDTDKLFRSFRDGYRKYGPLWQEILPLPVRRQLEDVLQENAVESFYYPSDLWARILFNFAVAYKDRESERDGIVRALIPFYHSRVLSFVNKTRQLDTQEAEEYLEEISRVFENEKYYLIERWEESKSAHTPLLFR